MSFLLVQCILRYGSSPDFRIVFSGVLGGSRWRSWLRRRATSGKIVGSIPELEYFIDIVLFGHTVARGLTQSLTEISTRGSS